MLAWFVPEHIFRDVIIPALGQTTPVTSATPPTVLPADKVVLQSSGSNGGGGSTDTTKHPERSPETIQVSAPIDLELGVGYRIPTSSKPEQTATSGVDFHLTLDLGQFKSLDYTSVARHVSGDIAGDKQAMHVALGLGVGYHFAP